jgi:hypothetical protein
MDRTDIPAPFYAAAGAGEAAYERLRRLPGVASRTAEGLRQRFAAPERDLSAELARVRESAQRGTAAVLARAVTVQDQAVAGYWRLVARGERVMAERIGVATHAAQPAPVEVVVGPVQPAERPATGNRTGPAAEAPLAAEAPPDQPARSGD